jgi:hypothetical protein
MERLETHAIKEAKKKKGQTIYLSLNKPAQSMKKCIGLSQGQLKSYFFIDAIQQEVPDGMVHVPAERLDLLLLAVKEFCETLEKPRIIIDGLSTLLLYNTSRDVAKFTQSLLDYAADDDISITAFSQESDRKELVSVIYNFFETVRRKR